MTGTAETPERTLLVKAREIGELGLGYAVQLEQLAANLFADPLRSLLRVVLHFDFEEQIGAAHRWSNVLNLYTKGVACAICEVRRPKRFCPGVRGDICTICCGTEREVSVTCPLDCEYLQDARRHEKPVELDASKLPNQDIRVTEKLLSDCDELVAFLGMALGTAALETPGVGDFDVRDALQALIRTYRSLQSGVYYETRPQNALADAVFRLVQDGIAKFRREEQERLGMPRTRDADVLTVLVFFERLELGENNGRRRGRAFIGLLRNVYGAPLGSGARSNSPLVLP